MHKCTSIVCTFINEMAQRSSEIIGLIKQLFGTRTVYICTCIKMYNIDVQYL